MSSVPSGPPRARFDAVVLAGDGSRRLGGADKAAVTVGGRTLLDRVLGACRDAERTVVVGPRRPTVRPVRWAREEPAGGGPLAALGAGLEQVAAPVVVLLAVDLPFLDRPLIHALAAPPAGADGLVVADAEGREQPLTGGYRTAALRRALTALATAPAPDAPPGLHGLPMRRLRPRLTLRRLATNGPLDCDTWADIAAARARIREHGHVLEEWLAAVKAELDIDPEVDTTALLDAARDAAHGVTRPAAPLTTFLLGYAAALHGTDQAEAARKVAALAADWAREQEPAGSEERS